MNYKLVYPLILCFIPFLAASENPVLAAKQRMLVQMQVNNGYSENYEIQDIRKNDMQGASRTKEVSVLYQYPTKIEKQAIEELNQDIKVFITSDAILIKGQNTNQYDIRLTGDSFENFKKSLEKVNEERKHLGYNIRNFEVSLTNQDVTKGVSFSLTEEQYQFITQKSYGSKIIAIFGLAGLIALIYYFHPKYMALLGRA